MKLRLFMEVTTLRLRGHTMALIGPYVVLSIIVGMFLLATDNVPFWCAFGPRSG